MTLTKEIIEREMRIWERNGYIEGTVWARHYIDLCRLAMLGLERDERAERIGRAVLDVMVSFAHPAYGPVGTLRGMAAILRKPHHGPFDQTPALLDAIAAAMEDEA